MRSLSRVVFWTLVVVSFSTASTGLLLVIPEWWLLSYQGYSSGLDYCHETQVIPAEVNLGSDIHGGSPQLRWVPFGMGCSWMLRDGSWTFVATTDPLPSLLLYGGAIGLATAAVFPLSRITYTSRV